MYPSVRGRPPIAPDVTPDIGLRGHGGIEANVVYLGLTSLFTDISAEMVTAVLPLYLTVQLGFSPLEFGAFDGLYQAMAAVAAIVAGVRADRWRRHKEVAGAGYALSVVASSVCSRRRTAGCRPPPFSTWTAPARGCEQHRVTH